jgi:hypothetical protein
MPFSPVVLRNNTSQNEVCCLTIFQLGPISDYGDGCVLG